MDPREPWPSTRDVPATKTETCEVCGQAVSAASVVKCAGHYSYWPCRPERKAGR